MKKSILLFLRAEGIKNPKQSYFSLDSYLLRNYPGAAPREVKRLLNELQAEGLCGVSGSWGTLGARFGGVEQGLKQVTIQAHLTAKGVELATEYANTLPQSNGHTPLFSLENLNKALEATTPVTSTAAVEPAAVEPAAVEPAAVEPAAVEPAAVEPAAVEPAAVEPVAAEPAPEAQQESIPEDEL